MAPQIRVDGHLSGVPDYPKLTPTQVDDLLAELLSGEQAASWIDQHEFDFAFSWKQTARVRGNAYTQRGSTAVALRIIPLKVPTMAELDLPPAMEAFIHQPQGLVLVTGPTGSGKSTTLASMIHQISIDRACHIITIEDPIEYLHPHRRSAVDQREVGSDTASFADGLRSILREDPDVLLV
ncbi:MAG: Flp pilus assembly complex ATPase component TadA, partial [Dermatophilaceae bacterium]|nr:Flp pilus assembly complex ATPase component TadA [Dermatophilaceae bacterium]